MALLVIPKDLSIRLMGHEFLNLGSWFDKHNNHQLTIPAVISENSLSTIKHIQLYNHIGIAVGSEQLIQW